MEENTFDEGIALGGMRSKNEIRTLICYLFNSVKQSMNKEDIVQSIIKQGLANYFEVSSVFDELVTKKILIANNQENDNTYTLSEDGKTIATRLESTIAYTAKEKSYACAIKLLANKQIAKNNFAQINKTENGFNVECKITDGNIVLLSFSIYAPSFEQATIIKNNFYDSPIILYKSMLAFLTKDKESVGDALNELYASMC